MKKCDVFSDFKAVSRWRLLYRNPMHLVNKNGFNKRKYGRHEILIHFESHWCCFFQYKCVNVYATAACVHQASARRTVVMLIVLKNNIRQ